MQRSHRKSTAALLVTLGLLSSIGVVLAANTTTLSQTITNGTLAVDIVDAGGTTVASPSVTFGSTTFSFSSQTTTGTLGTASQKIRTSNPTSTATWGVALAATSGPTSLWTSGGNTFDFNDTGATDTGVDVDTKGGQLTWSGGGTFAGVPDSTACPTTGLSIASSTPYLEGTTNSISVLTGGASATTFCRWDYTSASTNLSQVIPSSQPSGTYTLGMTLTIS